MVMARVCVTCPHCGKEAEHEVEVDIEPPDNDWRD